jgi:hypothetical protein
MPTLVRVDAKGCRGYLLDDYEISYAPSAILARISKERHDSSAKRQKWNLAQVHKSRWELKEYQEAMHRAVLFDPALDARRRRELLGED